MITIEQAFSVFAFVLVVLALLVAQVLRVAVGRARAEGFADGRETGFRAGRRWAIENDERLIEWQAEIVPPSDGRHGG